MNVQRLRKKSAECRREGWHLKLRPDEADDLLTALDAAEALAVAVDAIQLQAWPPNWALVYSTLRAFRAAMAGR